MSVDHGQTVSQFIGNALVEQHKAIAPRLGLALEIEFAVKDRGGVQLAWKSR